MDVHPDAESFTPQCWYQAQGLAIMPIPANGTVALGPSGYHLMLMDLKAPLQKGETFKASLTFEHAGTIEAIFHVGSAGASGPDDPPSDSPEHQH